MFEVGCIYDMERTNRRKKCSEGNEIIYWFDCRECSLILNRYYFIQDLPWSASASANQ